MRVHVTVILSLIRSMIIERKSLDYDVSKSLQGYIWTSGLQHLLHEKETYSRMDFETSIYGSRAVVVHLSTLNIAVPVQRLSQRAFDVSQRFEFRPLEGELVSQHCTTSSTNRANFCSLWMMTKTTSQHFSVSSKISLSLCVYEQSSVLSKNRYCLIKSPFHFICLLVEKINFHKFKSISNAIYFPFRKNIPQQSFKFICFKKPQ